ncbi:ras association domain-containing protein 7 isoform X4 [Mirounga angustirostris]|uniref:ras association domain-containing protein 7 isoform X4 n=1 Tax=Mirounga angustirostris TaxID=9716 RepID=UPI00313DDB16
MDAPVAMSVCLCLTALDSTTPKRSVCAHTPHRTLDCWSHVCSHRTGMLSGLAAMELKVWVDGIQRVVCGVSEQTTCQEVVIALAQAIGQTGRFVLVQRLREKERQLLPQECPVGAQATCGQFASDVQFVLRRTGPSLAGRPSSDSCPPPERCPVRASLPPKPRPALGHEQRQALTFSLGCPGLAPSPALPEPVAPVAPIPGSCADLQSLERRVRRNAVELGQEAFWEQELRREQAREREGQVRLQALSAATAEHAARLQALDAQARALEAELHLASEAPGPPSPTASATERLRQDLAAQERQSAQVQGSLALVSRALEAAEHALQDLLPPAREEPLTRTPQNPALVSGLSPEIAPMRQNSWR